MNTTISLSLLPREKLFQYGVENLSTQDLIALVLGRGGAGKSVFSLAEELETFLSRQIQMPEVENLLQIKGLGVAKASQIMACLELSGRFLLGRKAFSANSPEELVRHLSFLKNETQEKFVMVSFNASNRLIAIHTLTVGLVDKTQVHPREAFAKAIEDRAVAVIFAHNHPSGNTHPSEEDKMTTRHLCQVGHLLEIPVLDHIILSPCGYCSIKRDFPYLFDET
jgi:DNA repair protein RadC